MRWGKLGWSNRILGMELDYALYLVEYVCDAGKYLQDRERWDAADYHTMKFFCRAAKAHSHNFQ